MFLEFLFVVFRANARAEAVIWRDQSFSYGELLTRTELWRSYLQKNDVTNGTVVAIDADFSPNAIALMLALIETGCIVVPLTASVAAKKSDFMKIAEVAVALEVTATDEPRLTRFHQSATHEILQQLRRRAHPGLILFSSGSTGESNAAVPDIMGMANKVQTRRPGCAGIDVTVHA